jgi:hypothetical protein
VKILPCMSKGICFRLPDGSVAMLPLHVFRVSGSTVIRIGETTLTFDEAGRFDGEELHMVGGDAGDVAKLTAALEQSAKNQGQAPESFYFEEGSPGRVQEERSRAALAQDRPPQRGRAYSHVPGAKPKGELN